MTRTACATSKDQQRGSQLVWGLALMLLGSALLLDSLGFWDIRWRDLWSQWPFLLIGLGLVRFLTPMPKAARAIGLWQVFVGMLGLAHTYRVLRFQDSWPLFLVGIGAVIAFQAFDHPRPIDESGARHDD
jgi:uncharacterized membrane protein HdeD (DUF308 family)